MTRRRNVLATVAVTALSAMVLVAAPATAFADDEVTDVISVPTEVDASEATQELTPEAPAAEEILPVEALADETPQTTGVPTQEAVVNAAPAEEAVADELVQPSNPNFPPTTIPDAATADEIAAAGALTITSLDVAQEFTATFRNVRSVTAGEWLYSYLVLPNGSSYALSWARVQPDSTGKWYFGSDLPNGAYPMVVQSPDGARVWSWTVIVWNGNGPVPVDPNAPQQPQEPTPGTPEQPQEPSEGTGAPTTPGTAPEGGTAPQNGGAPQNGAVSDRSVATGGVTTTAAGAEELAHTGVGINAGLLAAFALALMLGGTVLSRIRRQTI